MYVREKKCVLIYIYIYIAFAIKLHICWMLFTIRCMWYMIILEFRKYGGNKEKMLDLLKCASNRNLLSGETLTSGQEPCGLTGTSWCFQPRCLQFKFPSSVIVTMLNDQKSGVKLTSLTWMLALGNKTTNTPT